jgi:nucleotide-binding universal stress UspA family protein
MERFTLPGGAERFGCDRQNREGRLDALGLLLTSVSTAASPAGDLYLVVGYDGSAPAGRALDAAVSLLEGRAGRIEAVYVAHIPYAGVVSAAALAEMELNFDEVEQELRAEAGKRLGGRSESWGFVRRQGLIADQLIAVAQNIRDAHGERVAIVVGSSSHAMHRVVGGHCQPGPPLTGPPSHRALVTHRMGY